MDDLELIKCFREICGDPTEEGYELHLNSGINVPNFVNYGHKATFPQIIIKPFVSRTQLAETIVFCGEGEDRKRMQLKYNHSRFQIDIYSKKTVELMQIKTALFNRMEDFIDVEIIAYKENAGWEPYSTNVYLNNSYDTRRNISQLKDPLAILTRVDTLEEVLETAGSWFLSDEGLFVNPLIDLESVDIYEVLHGLVFSNGETAYDKGIQAIARINDRTLNDKNPEVERWGIDVMISYRESREINIGSRLEEWNIYGERD